MPDQGKKAHQCKVHQHPDNFKDVRSLKIDLPIRRVRPSSPGHETELVLKSRNSELDTINDDEFPTFLEALVLGKLLFKNDR